MTRSVVDSSETEGDFALGMGIAIGMFIALFAVGIALFVIQQSTAHSAAPQVKEPRRATATAVLRDAPPVATPTSAPQ
ncbi:MAG TPA: hypothetical protein VLW55_17890 [Burkholderiaceae bacterium]|nr:hypothetical protein [Burkholderiaceae bacterium]